MSRLGALYQLARADFLERVRRHGFLLTLLFAVYLGFAAGTGRIVLRLGRFRGVHNSAWIGTMMALVTAGFVSLAGFYIVKNAVERDRRTGVGQILASTPLGRISYVLGKALSNFAVLSAMVVILALAAVAMQVLRGEDPHVKLWPLLSPFLLLALPGLAVVAALAVLFEVTPGLRGGLGNVAYFFLWPLLLVAGSELTGSRVIDLIGFSTAMQSLEAAARAQVAGYKGGMSLAINPGTIEVTRAFSWDGMHWTGEMIAERLLPIGVALALVLFAAVLFDRFDPARTRPRLALAARKPEAAESGAAAGMPTSPHAAPAHLTPLTAAAMKFRFGAMLLAELRLALARQRWWWYAGAAGLLVAQFASPLPVARGPLLAAAWLWPVLVWSAMGVREARYATDQLVFSSVRSLARQLPAVWLAGATLAALTGCGALLRLALAGDVRGVLAWVAGGVFVPTLALALGVASGSSKPFEAVYTILWYIGPLERVPAFDFTGATPAANRSQMTLVYFALTALLLGAAFLLRRLQSQR